MNHSIVDLLAPAFSDFRNFCSPCSVKECRGERLCAGFSTDISQAPHPAGGWAAFAHPAGLFPCVRQFEEKYSVLSPSRLHPNTCQRAVVRPLSAANRSPHAVSVPFTRKICTTSSLSNEASIFPPAAILTTSLRIMTTGCQWWCEGSLRQNTIEDEYAKWGVEVLGRRRLPHSRRRSLLPIYY